MKKPIYKREPSTTFSEADKNKIFGTLRITGWKTSGIADVHENNIFWESTNHPDTIIKVYTAGHSFISITAPAKSYADMPCTTDVFTNIDKFIKALKSMHKTKHNKG